MSKRVEESNSDGLEIVSIGTLYSGQLDKKYWSSSRGKDRYPYPIGYQALRTHNGLTYTMEVHEGTKGPIFQVTSNDKQSGSGDTPDRAWGNFQKKCSSRVKLLPGKRLSGKVDGVEFFGFKNALVQRLLRELVATINDASDQSSKSTNLSKATAKGGDVEHPSKYQSPELTAFLDKPEVTGKRSRSCRGVDTKSASKRSHKICQPSNETDIGKDPCSIRVTSNDDPMLSSTSSICEIDQGEGALLLFPDMALGHNVPLSGHNLPVKSVEALDDSKSKSSLADARSKLVSAEKCSSASLTDVDLPQEEKSLDRQCTSALQRLPVATEIKNGNAQIIPDELDSRPPLLADSKVNNPVELCIPDTLDAHQDSCNDMTENATSWTELVADTVFSKEPTSGSHSEDGSYYLTGSSEKYDYNAVGEGITNSMLSVLLPRAIPFLKYSSKKKKRKARPSEELSCGLKSDDKLVETLPIVDDIPTASTHTTSDVEGVQKADPLNVHANPSGSVLENVQCLVPDSLDNGDTEYPDGNKLPPSSENAEKVSTDFRENSISYGKSSSKLLNATKLVYKKKKKKTTRVCKEKFDHEEQPKDCDIGVQKDNVLVSHLTVDSQSCSPTNRFGNREDDCPSAEANSMSTEDSSKKMERETIPDGKGMFSKDSAGLLLLSEAKNTLPSNTVPKKDEYCAPLSESIICRNNGDVPKMDHVAENLVSPDSCQLYGIRNTDRSKTSFGVQGNLERQTSYPKDENAKEALAHNSSFSVLQEQEHSLNRTFTKDGEEFIDGFDLRLRNSQSYPQKNKIGAQSCTSHIEEDYADAGVDGFGEPKSSEEMEGNMKLIGCYSHPMQISSVKLAEVGHEIYICVSCGPGENGERELFLYKLPIKEPILGSPFMVGHTSMRLPLLKDEFGKEVVIDNSGIQFTPDARGLVLTDSIRMPYCREKNLHCSCPQCESCFYEENAVKIVQIQRGYATLILKLNTIYAVHCILVCEPNCLVAVDESGRIYIWIMDPTWSIPTEQHIIPSYDLLPSRIIELKRVPKSSSLVIGHNGYGHFSLWDIVKRSVVAKFSTPASSVLHYLPVGLFTWEKKRLSRDKVVMEECVKKLVEESMLWFSGHNEDNVACPTDGNDVALWVLMYTSSDSNVPYASFSSNDQSNSDGCWRLCLLFKSTVLMGAPLPSSSAAIGTSSGVGIIGTYKGHVDIWELASGIQVGRLHCNAGNKVSQVAVDDSTSSIVAVAHDGGQLCVYVHH